MLLRHGKRRYTPEQWACIRRCTKSLVCVRQEDVMAALNLDPEGKKVVDQVSADLLAEAVAEERMPKDLGLGEQGSQFAKCLIQNF